MTATSVAAGTTLDQLRAMALIRRFEERVSGLRHSGDIVGSVHLCIGQETTPVGACAALGEQDGVIATGVALAARYDGSGRVVVCALGDGAMNQGAVHEAMNFAAALDLPVIFVCENNRYSELTPIADMVRSDRLFERAATVVSWGRMVLECLAAAELVATEGVDVEVIDGHWLAPFDTETILGTIARTGRLAVVHEANLLQQRLVPDRDAIARGLRELVAEAG